MFAMTYILSGRSIACQFIVAGLFYAYTLTICGSVPPCKSVMDLLPERSKSTGKAEPFFYFSHKINYTDMTYSENCQAPAQNEQPFNVVNHHIQNLCKTIKDFYAFANASEFIEANNVLLHTYLEIGMDEEEGYCPKHIQNIVFMVTLQNKFLTALKEDWELYKEFANPKIETI